MSFRRSIGWSVAGHIAIMAIAIFGLPNIREHKVEPTELIAVDVIDFSEAAQRAGEKLAPKAEPKPRQVEKASVEPVVKPQEIKPREVENVAPPPPRAEPKVEPKKVEAKPEPKPEVKPEPKPEAKRSDVKPEIKAPETQDQDALLKKITEAQKSTPKVEPTPQPKPEPKVEPKAESKPQPVPQKTADSKVESKPTPNSTAQSKTPTQTQNTQPVHTASTFDPSKISQLLNKDNKPASTQSGVQGKPTEATQGAPKGLGSKLTQSQYAALQNMIREQVSKCWSPPAGASASATADLKVKLDIAMNADGSLAGIPQVTNSSSDPNFRATAESAVRAVRRCAPLKLPADQYAMENGWKEIEFIFDPNLI